VQRCINHPGLADLVREIYISDEMVLGQAGYLPVGVISNINESLGHDSLRSQMLAYGRMYDWNGYPAIPAAMVTVVLCTKLEKTFFNEMARINCILPDALLADCAVSTRSSEIRNHHVYRYQIYAPSQYRHGIKMTGDSAQTWKVIPGSNRLQVYQK
jgi:hypothetical protein